MIHQKIALDPAAEGLAVRQDARLIATIVATATVYATVRYNVFKGVPWGDWPHFIGNKILAVSALVLISAAVLRLVFSRDSQIRRIMAAGSAMALAHTLISFGLFQPSYFDKYFAGTKLTLPGGLSLVLAAFAMALLNWGKGQRGSSRPGQSALLLGVIALLSGVHAGFPSVATWLEPWTWPGGLPPITLISFLIGLFAMLLGLRARRRRFA